MTHTLTHIALPTPRHPRKFRTTYRTIRAIEPSIFLKQFPPEFSQIYGVNFHKQVFNISCLYGGELYYRLLEVGVN